MPKIVDKAQMRSDIIDATLRVFMQKGFGATSMNDIAKEAHVAKGTLYLYFENKERLIDEIAKGHFALLQNKLFAQEDFDSLDDFLKHLEAALTLNHKEQNSILMFFEIFGFHFSSGNLGEVYHDFSAQAGQWYAQVLANLQTKKMIDTKIDTTILGKTLFGMIDGLLIHQSIFKTQDRDTIHETLRFVRKGLQKND